MNYNCCLLEYEFIIFTFYEIAAIKHGFTKCTEYLLILDHNKLQKYSPWLQKVPRQSI